jgi:hypothetical protein
MLSHLYFSERGMLQLVKKIHGDLFQALKDLKHFPG